MTPMIIDMKKYSLHPLRFKIDRCVLMSQKYESWYFNDSFMQTNSLPFPVTGNWVKNRNLTQCNLGIGLLGWYGYVVFRDKMYFFKTCDALSSSVTLCDIFTCLRYYYIILSGSTELEPLKFHWCSNQPFLWPT